MAVHKTNRAELPSDAKHRQNPGPQMTTVWHPSLEGAMCIRERTVQLTFYTYTKTYVYNVCL